MVNRGGAKYGREREREEFSLGGNEYVPCVLIRKLKIQKVTKKQKKS